MKEGSLLWVMAAQSFCGPSGIPRSTCLRVAPSKGLKMPLLFLAHPAGPARRPCLPPVCLLPGTRRLLGKWCGDHLQRTSRLGQGSHGLTLWSTQSLLRAPWGGGWSVLPSLWAGSVVTCWEPRWDLTWQEHALSTVSPSAQACCPGLAPGGGGTTVRTPYGCVVL